VSLSRRSILPRMISLSRCMEAPWTISTCHGWRLPPVAARAALSASALSSAGSTGVSRNPRTDRRASTAALTSIYVSTPCRLRQFAPNADCGITSVMESRKMPEAYIVEAVRTAGGRRGGRLAGWHPVDLAAKVLDALVERSGVPADAIDDVIMGCVSQGGEQAGQVGRNAVLASKLPESTPAVTIDRQCGSSQQAMQFAAQAVMSGTQ